MIKDNYTPDIIFETLKDKSVVHVGYYEGGDNPIFVKYKEGLEKGSFEFYGCPIDGEIPKAAIYFVWAKELDEIKEKIKSGKIVYVGSTTYGIPIVATTDIDVSSVRINSGGVKSLAKVN